MSQSQEMTNSQSSPRDEPKQRKACIGGCGFWGSPEHMDYCSQCYRTFVPEAQRKEREQAQQQAEQGQAQGGDEEKTKSPAQSAESSADATSGGKKTQKKKNRCWQCRKKLTLAGRFQCKCGYIFCSLHRHEDSHDCDFDWQADHQKKLDVLNPVVAPSKLEKF